MQALLLAAGLGTRLKPLTNYLPKCLVPIHGRPLLDYWLDCLVSNGVKRILINTHYLSPLVEEYVRRSTWLPYVTMVYEDNLRGTGGTILKNREFFGSAPILVAHADNLTLFSVHDFIARHLTRPKCAEMTMMLFETPDPTSCGIVELDNQAIVTAFHEKVANPPGNLANAAVYILEPQVVEWMAKLQRVQLDLSTEVIPHFIGKIATYYNNNYHRDIGTMASWRAANREFPKLAASELNTRAWMQALSNSAMVSEKVIEQLLITVD